VKSIPKKALGFSLIEVMIAITLGLILMSAVLAVFMSSKRTYSSSEAMSRSQESARFGSQFVARELRMAGYASLDTDGVVSRTVKFPADSTFATAGQVITGVDQSGGTGTIKAATDSVTYRYTGGNASSVRDCLGATVASGTIVNVTLFVSDDNELLCQVGSGTATALIDGIDNMQLLYGVDTDGDRAANSYVAAGAVTNWTQVVSVQVTLTIAAPTDQSINARSVVSVAALRNQLP